MEAVTKQGNHFIEMLEVSLIALREQRQQFFHIPFFPQQFNPIIPVLGLANNFIITSTKGTWL